MSNDILVKAEGVSKKFCRDLKRSLWYGVQDTIGDLTGRNSADQALRPDEFWAIDDVSFALKRGECLGLVGRNGAGKTTLLKMLNGLVKPDRGRIEIRGRVGALIALGAGFNPVLTGRENIYINGAVLGLSKKEIDARYDEIVDFAELDDFIDAPVQSYSSGMQVRLGFAVATALNPDVLLLDEVLAVGDAAFRTKCFERIGKVLADAAVIFVSHSQAQVSRVCDTALLLSGGKVVDRGTSTQVLERYRLFEGSARARPHRVAHQHVADVDLEVQSSRIGFGDDLVIVAKFTLHEAVQVGAIIVHFWRDGDFVASGDVSYDHEKDGPSILAAGVSRMRIRLGPLHLQHGRYSVSFSVFDGSRKQTITQCLHFAEIEVAGPVGAGPPHVVPMAVALPSGTDRAAPVQVHALSALGGGGLHG
jgi:lipopolysaccharide transport system ATP-binding protein